MNRQDERKAETRARLLAAAAERFAEQGVDGVSVDAVAEAAGRTSGAVYAHFGSKQGLLLALLDDLGQALVMEVDAELGRSEDLPDRMRALWDNLFGRPTERTRRLLLLEHELGLRAARDPDVAVALRARSRRTGDRLTRGLARWADQGAIDPAATPEQLSALLRAVVLGVAMLERVDPGSIDGPAVVDLLASLLGGRVTADAG